MNFLGRIPKDGVSTIQGEIDELRARKKMLGKQLETAEASLSKAIDDRRRQLLESDLDKTNGQPIKNIVGRLRDERDAVTDALDSIAVKLAEAEQRLVAERDKAARDAERQRRQEQLDHVRLSIEAYQGALTRLIESLEPLRGAALSIASILDSLKYLSPQIQTGLKIGVADIGAYIEQMLVGRLPIAPEAAPAAVPKPLPPPMQRQVVFLRHAAKWVEDGEIKTSGPHTTPALPAEVARLALEYDHAVAMDSPTAAGLRAQKDPDYAFWDPSRCVDLMKPKPAPQSHEIGTMRPVVHSVAARAPQIGTAYAAPVR
jgi:hypothetical protein